MHEVFQGGYCWVLRHCLLFQKLKSAFVFLSNSLIPPCPLTYYAYFIPAPVPKAEWRSQKCVGGVVVVCAIRRAISFKTWINIWILLITRGVKWLALFPQWEHHISASKDKKKAWCSGFRSQEWRLGGFKGECNMRSDTTGKAGCVWLLWFGFTSAPLCSSCFQRTVAIFCEITLPYLIKSLYFFPRLWILL